MAAEGSGEAGAPNLNLTPDEKRVYGQLFRQADTDNVGVVTGEVAVKFFERTRLDSRILGEVWQIADKQNRGFLTPQGFSVALRLIAHSQAGREPTPDVALQPGPIPRLEGFTPTPAPLLNQVSGRGTPAPLQAQGTGGPIRIPPLMPDRVAQYTTLFERQNLQGNMLPGDQAKAIFEKSGLPLEILGRIWQLADTEQRGALVLTEFVIAMHLLTSSKSGQLQALPNMVPAALYEAATRRGSPILSRQQSPTTTAGFGPLPGPIPRQLSGQAGMRAGSPLGRPPIAAQQSGQNWLVTPQEKARCDTFFNKLDESKKGYITGEEAVAFFSQSNLPEDTLAQIWDLADVKSEGTLNAETFAVAMHLISQTRGKRDGPAVLPTTLPPNLIPVSMRNQVQPPRPPPPVSKPSAMDDLVGLEAFGLPAAPLQTATVTGSSNVTDPFASGLPPGSPSRASPTVTGFGKPFIPSSSFGLSMSKPASDSTSSIPSFSRPIPQQQPQSAAVEDDLLGDNDADASSKLNSETTELANLSNQISSLSTHMHEVQGKRSTTQNELNQASAQKKNFEQRLVQLRTLYEKEAQDVRALEEQLRTHRSDTGKLAGELASVESTYHELQEQHQQYLSALQADQQENASLKERIKAVNNEITQIRPQVEKLKSDARQHKGLVAINKKQLATVEGDRDKLKTEVDDLTRSNEELTRQLSMSPPPASIASPALSATSGNNPFFKRSGSTDIIGAFASPPAKTFNDTSFDDIFGPSAPAPVPAAAFQAQYTGESTGSAASFATPATSNTPTMSRQATLAMEPPAPPISRQMSSSILPFGEMTESLTSSRHVSPPLSRSGGPDPLAAPAKPIEDLADATSATDSTADASAFLPVSKAVGSVASAVSQVVGSAASAVSKAVGSSDAVPAESATEVAKSPVSHARGDSVNDPFSPVDQAKAKEDFESAFASFKNTKAQASEPSGSDAPKPFSHFNSEFPPISELERDDDSESDSDRGGFDDDFAPVSPPPKARDKVDAAKTPASTLDKAATSTGAAPTPATAAAEVANPFGAARENPASPSAAVSSPGARQATDDLFGSTTSKLETLPAPAPAKAPFDDSDDDFEGLEDAKEGSADDDFATISRSGLDDYNPVFDSSPPQSHAAKSDSNMTGATAPFGAESSFDFASLGSSTGGSTAGIGGSPAVVSTQNGSAAGSSGSKGAQAHDSQDWDAIFTTLDEAPPAPGATVTAATDSGSTETTGLKAPERPVAGRALTEKGEHDDPILKNLTGMGYSRKDALSALEKYDYNLERAANFLASQS